MILSRRFGFTGDPLLCSVTDAFLSVIHLAVCPERPCFSYLRRKINFLSLWKSRVKPTIPDKSKNTRRSQSRANATSKSVIIIFSFLSRNFFLSLSYTNFSIIFEVNRQRNILYKMSAAFRLILICSISTWKSLASFP